MLHLRVKPNLHASLQSTAQLWCGRTSLTEGETAADVSIAIQDGPLSPVSGKGDRAAAVKPDATRFHGTLQTLRGK